MAYGAGHARSRQRPEHGSRGQGAAARAAEDRRAGGWEIRSTPPFARAFRHRNYRLFYAGQLISLVGTWMQSVAQSWLVYRLTGSATLLGLVSFAGQMPVFLLAAIGGTVADRHHRHRILILTQTASMVQAFVLAGLTLTGRVEVWHVFALAALMGVVNAFDIPTRQSFIVELVGKEDLINAIALNSTMFNAARVIGPAIAGVLVATLGEGWCFFVNAASYSAVIVGLTRMDVRPRARLPARDSPLREILEGFRFVAETAPIRTLLLMIGLVSLMGMPYSVLMPIFADRILGGGAGGLGVLMAASGVGATAGSLLLASRTGVAGLGRWIVVATAGLGLSLIVFATSRSFWLSAIALLPVGLTTIVQMASSNTLIQAMVPDRLRGRAMAAYSMMFMGMAPLGALLAGFLAGRLGAPTTVAAGGVVCLVGTAVFANRLPNLRVEGHELIVAQQMAGGDPAEESNSPDTT